MPREKRGGAGLGGSRQAIQGGRKKEQLRVIRRKKRLFLSLVLSVSAARFRAQMFWFQENKSTVPNDAV